RMLAVKFPENFYKPGAEGSMSEYSQFIYFIMEECFSDPQYAGHKERLNALAQKIFGKKLLVIPPTVLYAMARGGETLQKSWEQVTNGLQPHGKKRLQMLAFKVLCAKTLFDD